MHIYLDFETGSDVDLMVEGRARYMHHPSTYVQICSFQIDDEPMITETVHTGFQSFAKAISEYVITKQAKIVALMPSLKWTSSIIYWAWRLLLMILLTFRRSVDDMACHSLLKSYSGHVPTAD